MRHVLLILLTASDIIMKKSSVKLTSTIYENKIDEEVIKND